MIFNRLTNYFDMHPFTILMTSIIAIIHFYILYLEMILWNTEKGRKVFGMKDKNYADQTKVLAANQGLYNGFLAAGLVFSLVDNNLKMLVFFLVCIFIAGIFGAVSTKKTKILWIQTAPALIALLSTFF